MWVTLLWDKVSEHAQSVVGEDNMFLLHSGDWKKIGDTKNPAKTRLIVWILFALE